MEWAYHSKPARWVFEQGGWRATVERQVGPRVRWMPRVERVGESPQRYEGPMTGDDPMHGRMWCLTKIAELRA